MLEKIAKYVGGQAAGLLSKDAVGNSGIVYYQVGVDPHFVRLYSETFWKFDPVANLSNCELEQIVSIPDLVPYDQFLASRFYREWAQPQGWVDAANAVLEKTSASCAYLSVIRKQTSGMVDAEMRRRMSLIVPHVRRAVRTGKVIDLRQAEAATFADILDGLSPAIFLVDAEGQIVHGNAASRSMLDRGGLLRAVHGRLTAGDTQVDQALHKAISAAGASNTESESRGSAVPLKDREGERYVAHVLPLTASEPNKAGRVSTAVAAYLCGRPSWKPRRRPRSSEGPTSSRQRSSVCCVRSSMSEGFVRSRAISASPTRR